MHVAHILRCMAERMGGPPRSVRGLGAALAARGHRVTYFSAANRKDMAELAACGPEIRRYPMDWPHGWFRSRALAEDLGRSLPHIDLLHVHGVWSHPHYVAAKLGRRTGTPYIVAPRGELEPWRVRNGALKHAKKVAYLSLLGNTTLRGAACLHAITPCEVDGFRRAGYRGPVTIVPNGVDADRFARLPNPAEAESRWPVLKGRRVVLFLSRLKTEKGLDRLLPAWHRLAGTSGTHDDALLVLAGPDDRGFRKVVEALIERYGMARRVLLTGTVRGREKLALISRADLFTLPSYSEGFSIALLENLAAGKPVLISPGCNFPEVAEAGAGLCVPPESGALADALRTILDLSPAERAAMGRRGRELVVGRYSWQQAAEKMITVYRCLLDGREIPENPQPHIGVRAAA